MDDSNRVMVGGEGECLDVSTGGGVKDAAANTVSDNTMQGGYG